MIGTRNYLRKDWMTKVKLENKGSSNSRKQGTDKSRDSGGLRKYSRRGSNRSTLGKSAPQSRGRSLIKSKKRMSSNDTTKLKTSRKLYMMQVWKMLKWSNWGQVIWLKLCLTVSAGFNNKSNYSLKSGKRFNQWRKCKHTLDPSTLRNWDNRKKAG